MLKEASYTIRALNQEGCQEVQDFIAGALLPCLAAVLPCLAAVLPGLYPALFRAPKYF